MENRFTIIASFLKPHEAHLAKSRLVAEGIPAYLLDENVITLHFFYSQALGGVKIQVPREHAAQAKEIVFTDHWQELSEMFEMGPPVLCLKCGSETTYLLLGDPVTGVLGWLLAGIPAPIMRNKQICKRCGHLFDTPPPPTS